MSHPDKPISEKQQLRVQGKKKGGVTAELQTKFRHQSGRMDGVPMSSR